jgi:hypothetical protein
MAMARPKALARAPAVVGSVAGLTGTVRRGLASMALRVRWLSNGSFRRADGPLSVGPKDHVARSKEVNKLT